MATVDLRPAEVEVHAYADDDCTLRVTFDPVDAAAGTWAAQVRKTRHDDGALAEFTVDDSDAASGVLTLTLAADQVTGLVEDGQDVFVGVWDLERTSSARTYLGGAFYAHLDVTR